MASPDGWLGLSQAERDAAFDNTAAVTGSARLAAERVAASARLRSARPEGLDLPYGAGERQRWDLFPAADRRAPWLVFIHGGYWQKNGREDFAAVVEGILGLGWSAGLPGYTLAPQASLSDIVAEIGQALDWLAEHRRALGCDGPLVLGGWSAGACLAALHLDHPSVAAGLAISGLYDLEPLRATYLDAALRLSDAEIDGLSPIKQTPSPKPLLMAVGEGELPALLDQSRRYAAHRNAAGAPGRLMALEGANHFTVLEALQAREGPITRELPGLAGEPSGPAG